MNTEVTVREIIETKYLKDICRVVAGEKGLNRPVGWVHILEIRDIVDSCVDGKELVLTTGVGLVDSAAAVAFLEELINKGVSALCIETPLYLSKIDPALIEMADAYDFPLIEIFEISRFLEISKGLNTMILHKQSEIYSDADRYDNNLVEIEGKGTLQDGIKYTAEYLNVDIAYIPNKGKHLSTSAEMKKTVLSSRPLMTELQDGNDLYCRGTIAIKGLIVYGKNCGYLLFSGKGRELTDFDILILNRLSNRIKADLAENIRRKEENLYRNNQWIKEWLDGRMNEGTVRYHLREFGMPDNVKSLFVLSILLTGNPEDEIMEDQVLFDDFLMNTAVAVRGQFEEEDFLVLGYMEKNIVDYIVMSVETDKNLLIRKAERVIEKLRKNKQTAVVESKIDNKSSVIYMGRIVGSYDRLHDSLSSIRPYQKTGKYVSDGVLIYEKLHLKRILTSISDREILEEFISDYLGKLMDPENRELLYTLKIYYECNCSKQRTAEKLYIVRQTLYFRLQKIEDLIGPDFSEGERKSAIEFAVTAYYNL